MAARRSGFMVCEKGEALALPYNKINNKKVETSPVARREVIQDLDQPRVLSRLCSYLGSANEMLASSLAYPSRFT